MTRQKDTNKNSSASFRLFLEDLSQDLAQQFFDHDLNNNLIDFEKYEFVKPIDVEKSIDSLIEQKYPEFDNKTAQKSLKEKDFARKVFEISKSISSTLTSNRISGFSYIYGCKDHNKDSSDSMFFRAGNDSKQKKYLITIDRYMWEYYLKILKIYINDKSKDIATLIIENRNFFDLDLLLEKLVVTQDEFKGVENDYEIESLSFQEIIAFARGYRQPFDAIVSHFQNMQSCERLRLGEDDWFRQHDWFLETDWFKDDELELLATFAKAFTNKYLDIIEQRAMQAPTIPEIEAQYQQLQQNKLKAERDRNNRFYILTIIDAIGALIKHTQDAKNKLTNRFKSIDYSKNVSEDDKQLLEIAADNNLPQLEKSQRLSQAYRSGVNPLIKDSQGRTIDKLISSSSKANLFEYVLSFFIRLSVYNNYYEHLRYKDAFKLALSRMLPAPQDDTQPKFVSRAAVSQEAIKIYNNQRSINFKKDGDKARALQDSSLQAYHQVSTVMYLISFVMQIKAYTEAKYYDIRNARVKEAQDNPQLPQELQPSWPEKAGYHTNQLANYVKDKANRAWVR